MCFPPFMPSYPVVAKPPFLPTQEMRDMCETASACGLSEDECCLLFGITRPEFEKWLRESFDVGAVRANVRVGAAMLKIASDPYHKNCVPAATFWLQSRAGWRTNANVHVNANMQADDATKRAIVDEVLKSIMPQGDPVVQQAPLNSKLN